MILSTRKLTEFLTASGMILILSFGSVYSMIALRNSALSAVREDLAARKERIFVRLTRAQEKSLLSYRNYYYSYTGEYRTIPFHSVEEIDPALFFRLTEGKNVEAYAIIDRTGSLHTELRENEKIYGKNFGSLEKFSSNLCIMGMILLGCGVLLIPIERASKSLRGDPTGRGKT
jgi:hypothetical protein